VNSSWGASQRIGDPSIHIAAPGKRLRDLPFEPRPDEVHQLEPARDTDLLAAVEANLRAMLKPAYRAWVRLDPRVFLEKVTVPLLALNGGKDLWVDPKRNLPEIEACLRKAGNRSFRVLELPGLNHPFQHAETGTPAEIGSIEETISPEVLDLIADWIARVLDAGSSG
jgi:pimeloyl-ACP methyl ester carboxylesterase